MAVMTSDGIVGKVLLVYPSVAQVLLISDQSSGVGALLEKSRLQGVLRGTANGEVMLERVMSDEQVSPGETVLTSGGDQIFPKGLPIGTVTTVGSGKDLFLNIKIKPATDLSKLEEVLVLVEKQERQTPTEDAVHMRASDILAQRLPSVPDKPIADAKSVAGAGGAAAASTAGAQPKPETKPATGVAGKAQGLAASGTGSAKLPAPTKSGISTSPPGGVPDAAKNSSAARGPHISLVKDQPKPANSGSPVPKKPDSPGAPMTAPTTIAPTTTAPAMAAPAMIAPRTKAGLDASQPRPPSAPPKAADSSTPAQSNSHPPADETKPQ